MSLADHSDIRSLLQALNPTAIYYVEEVFAPPKTPMSFSRAPDGHGFIQVRPLRWPTALTVLVSTDREQSRAILHDLCGVDKLPDAMLAAIALDATCRVSRSRPLDVRFVQSVNVAALLSAEPNPTLWSSEASRESLIVTRDGGLPSRPRRRPIEVEGPVEPTFAEFAMNSFRQTMPPAVQEQPSPPTEVAAYRFDVRVTADINRVPISLPATLDILPRRPTDMGPGGAIPLVLLTFRSDKHDLSAMPTRARWMGREFRWIPGLSIAAIAQVKGPTALREILVSPDKHSLPPPAVVE